MENMDTELIIIQIVVVLVGIYLAFTENKKNIYVVTFLFNLATLIMYVVNKDFATSVSCTILTARAFIYINKDRLKERMGSFSTVIPVFFIGLHLVMGAVTLENPWQLLSMLAPSITTGYMWWGRNTQELRAGNFVTYCMWAVYEAVSGLYIVMASDIISTVVFGGAFIYKAAHKQTDQSSAIKHQEDKNGR